jgi:Spy/CpxP family protein refolding chaperone
MSWTHLVFEQPWVESETGGNQDHLNGVNSMGRCERSILALVAAGALLASSSGAYAQPVTGWGPIPTLENLQTGLLEMIKHLNLTHAQHEQVERIIANETMRLALTRGNPNLSVAKIFAQEHAIRSQARSQIASILTPSQKERVAKWVIHELEERERWSEDPTDFFSIPAIY